MEYFGVDIFSLIAQYAGLQNIGKELIKFNIAANLGIASKTIYLRYWANDTFWKILCLSHFRSNIGVTEYWDWKQLYKNIYCTKTPFLPKTTINFLYGKVNCRRGIPKKKSLKQASEEIFRRLRKCIIFQ